MGSFFTTCSITNQTIVDGQELVVQFLLPAIEDSYNDKTVLEIFLKLVKIKGFDEALKEFKQDEDEDKKDIGEKGMEHTGFDSLSWIPVGPIIKGKYNDCGDIIPLQDESNLQNIKVLEGLFGNIPFSSILDLAQDDRWYRLGILKNDKHWKLKGLENLSEPVLELCKFLNVTFIHSSVYDTAIQKDFNAEEGIETNSFDIEWKEKYIQENADALKTIVEIYPKYLEESTKPDADKDYVLEMKYELKIQKLSLFRNWFHSKLKPIYLEQLITVVSKYPDITWYINNCYLTYNTAGLRINIKPSKYGGQSTNWKGWDRIYKKLNPVLEECNL